MNEKTITPMAAMSAETGDAGESGARRRLDRRRDPVKTREQLIASGMVLFNNPGYFFTDSNQIARHAGFAPGTFYQHFKNKNELFQEVLGIWYQGIHEIVKAGVENHKSIEPLADFLALKLIPYFESWTGLRASMRALTATDATAKEFRVKRLADFIEVANKVRQSVGNEPLPKVEVLTLLMNLERAADGLSEGEFAALGVSRAEAEKVIKQTLLGFLKK